MVSYLKDTRHIGKLGVMIDNKEVKWKTIYKDNVEMPHSCFYFKPSSPIELPGLQIKRIHT